MSARDNTNTRKIKRVNTKKGLKVVVGSIGSDIRYDLKTRDISSNGFFLDFDDPDRFPFNGSSIMEIWIELEEGQVVFFNGRIARTISKEAAKDTGLGIPGIAVRIIQISQENQQMMAEFFQQFHEKESKELEAS